MLPQITGIYAKYLIDTLRETSSKLQKSLEILEFSLKKLKEQAHMTAQLSFLADYNEDAMMHEQEIEKRTRILIRKIDSTKRNLDRILKQIDLITFNLMKKG